MLISECNFLYLVAVLGFWLSAGFWGLLLTGAYVSYLGAGLGRSLWSSLLGLTGAGAGTERGGYLSALRDVFLYVLCPTLLVIAGCLTYWHYRLENRPQWGLPEGCAAGERASVWGVGLRWIPDRDAPCWMMENEVCLALWKSVSHDYERRLPEGDRYPVSFATSFSIREFVRNMERYHPVRGWHWSIPTGLQWKNACCAGAVEPPSRGKKDHGWLRANSGGHAHPIGGLPGNDWGLHDMIGNVAEICRDELGLNLYGGDYDSSSLERLETGCCCPDEADGYFWPLRYENDETMRDVGLRLCLEPNLMAGAFVGSTLLVRQTPTVVAYSNFVLIYGLIFLVLQIFLPRIAPHLPRPLRKWASKFSVFDDWVGLMKGGLRTRAWNFVVMVVKYVVDWAIGLVVVSPLTLIIPGLPDPEFSIPEALMVVVVGAAIGPFALTLRAAMSMARSEWVDLGNRSIWQKIRIIYACGFLPLALLFSVMIIKDYIRPFYRELTAKDAHAVGVAVMVREEKDQFGGNE